MTSSEMQTTVTHKFNSRVRSQKEQKSTLTTSRCVCVCVWGGCRVFVCLFRVVTDLYRTYDDLSLASHLFRLIVWVDMAVKVQWLAIANSATTFGIRCASRLLSLTLGTMAVVIYIYTYIYIFYIYNRSEPVLSWYDSRWMQTFTLPGCGRGVSSSHCYLSSTLKESLDNLRVHRSTREYFVLTFGQLCLRLFSRLCG